MRIACDVSINPVFPTVYIGEAGQSRQIFGEALTAIHGSEVDTAILDAMEIVKAGAGRAHKTQRDLLGSDKYLIGMELLDPDIGSGGIESMAVVAVDTRSEQGLVTSARLATWEKTGGENPLFSPKGTRIAALLRCIFAPALPINYEVGAAIPVDEYTTIYSFNPTPGYPSTGWFIRDLNKFLSIQGRGYSDSAMRAAAYAELVVQRDGLGRATFHSDAQAG